MSLPAAVLWDCDGTLVDSETVTERAMRAALAAMGHELTDELFGAMVGHPWPHSRQLLVDAFSFDEDELETFRSAYRRDVIPLLDDPSLVHEDALTVLDQLAAADVPVAVVTSSGREHLTRTLRLAPLRDRFAVRIARQDVAVHKPSPEPYLTALAALAHVTGRPLAPAQVVVVEDSGAGVAAGVAAGCRTVAVDRGRGWHDLSAADRVVTTLTLDALTPSSAAPQVTGADSAP